MEPILDYLVEKWPIFAMLVVSVIVTAVVVWLLSEWYHRFIKTEKRIDNLPCEKQDDLYHRFVNTEEKVDNMPCAKHEEIFSKINEKITIIHNVKEKVDNLPCAEHSKLLQDIREELAAIRTVKEKVDNLPCAKHEEMFIKINEELSAIRTALTMENPKFANYLSQKNSPRELSEDGRKLFADINGEEFLRDNKDILIKRIEDKNPKTPLDVEETSLKILLSLTDDDMFIGMKKWVYNSSPRKILIDGVEKTFDITMLDVCFILSLPLRNMYLELHEELL